MWECILREKTQLSKHKSYRQVTWGWESLSEHLQVKLLFPYRVQIPKDRFCPLLCFTHLNSHVWITGPSLVFGLQTLSTHHWKEKRRVTITLQQESVSDRHVKQQLITARETGISLMRAFLMSLSSTCTTVPAIGASPPATCMCTQQKDTEVRDALPLCSNFTPALLLEAPKWDQENPWVSHSPVIVIFADHFEVPSSTLCFTVFICWACVILLSQNTSLIKSKISGLFRSRIFMRSFMAMMKFWVRSSAPCFELFSAAPVHQKTHHAQQKQTHTKSCFTEFGQGDQSYKIPFTGWLLILTFTLSPPYFNIHRELGPFGGGGDSSSVIWDQTALLTTGWFNILTAEEHPGVRFLN